MQYFMSRAAISLVLLPALLPPPLLPSLLLLLQPAAPLLLLLLLLILISPSSLTHCYYSLIHQWHTGKKPPRDSPLLEA